MTPILKRMALLLTLSALVLAIAACGAKPENNNEGAATPTPNQSEKPAAPASTEPPVTEPQLLDSDQHPVLTIELSNDKVIKVELYPEVAPNTVNNMISLANKGFYDGLIFHRVMPGFMIQGGDPNGNGTGGPGYKIKGEFTKNKFENLLKHKRGVISMARARDFDSAGSQFFIMVTDYPSLDNEYASFGEVIEGMDAVDEIVAQESDANDRPFDPIAMKKVTVDTKKLTFEEPVTIQ